MLRPGLLLACQLASTGLPAAEPDAEPSGEEVELLCLLNRFRADPAGEAGRIVVGGELAPDLGGCETHGVDLQRFRAELAALAPVPPLVMDLRLLHAARLHAAELVAIGGGPDEDAARPGGSATHPEERANRAGFSGRATAENCVREALSPWSCSAAFVIDVGAGSGGMSDGRGHRATQALPDVRVVGTAAMPHAGRLSVSELFGTCPGRCVGGVVYVDRNHNGRFDAGEGLGGVLVAAGPAAAARTWLSGGYALTIPAGARELTLQLPDAVGSAERISEPLPAGTGNVWREWAIAPELLRARVDRRIAAIAASGRAGDAGAAIEDLAASLDDAAGEGQDAAVAALTALAVRDGDWWVLDTPQLTVRTMIDAGFTAAVTLRQARLRRQLGGLLALPPRALRDRPRVIVADSAVTCARLAKGQVAPGFFAFSFTTDGRILEDTVYTWAEPGQRTPAAFPFGLLAHEMTHQLLQGCAGRAHLPPVIDEGIAVVMQGWDPDRSLDENLGRLRRSPALPADDVAALPAPAGLVGVEDWNAADQTTVARRYAAAGSFVAWMLVDPLRRSAFTAALRAALHGGTMTGLLTDARGRRWERDWRAWLTDPSARPAASLPGTGGADQTVR
jgi:hypothetical protein